MDTGAQTATVSYDGDVILSGNPFSTVLVGGADIADIGDDMVISVGNGRLDLGGAVFAMPEPALPLGLVSGIAALAGLCRLRSRKAGRPLR